MFLSVIKKNGEYSKMEIIKIIGIALIALIIIIMLKQYRPEYAIFISILTGILILFLVLDQFDLMFEMASSKANFHCLA